MKKKNRIKKSCKLLLLLLLLLFFDFNPIVTKTILDIHRYLMKKHNIKKCLGWLRKCWIINWSS